MNNFSWGGTALPFAKHRRSLLTNHLINTHAQFFKVGSVMLLALFCLQTISFAQEKVKTPEVSKVYRPYLTGRVVSADSSYSVRATVSIEGTDILTYSDGYGNFNFRGVYLESGTLRLGHRQLDTPMKMSFDTINRGPFIFTLPVKQQEKVRESQQQDSMLQGRQIDTISVVETGFFRVPKERATGSFVHIDQQLLSRSVGSNILDRLEGVTRGLIFNNNQVGATTFASNRPSMSIRGISTLFANADPLIILDNFPYEDDINNINPEDIESVTVLQDAAAASIWGARAGNGVIVLTSKQGRFEQPLQISLRNDARMSEKPNLYYNPSIPMDEVIEIERFLYGKGAWDGVINDGYSYLTPTIEALLAHKNGHITESEMEARIAQLKTQDVRRDLNKYVYRPVQLYKTALNFRGGSKQHNYYFSAGYDKNLANMSGHDDERITLQAKNSYRMLGNRLLFDAQVQFTSDKKNTASDAPFQVLYNRLVDENGNPLSIGGGRHSGGLRQSYIDTAGNGLLRDWNFYPLENIGQYQSSKTQTSYQVRPSITYKPLDWLGIAANYQYSRSFSETEGLMDEDYFTVRDHYNKFSQINHAARTVTSALPKGSVLHQFNNGSSSSYFRGQFNMDKNWQTVHQLSLVGGMEFSTRKSLNRYMPSMIGYQPETESFTAFDVDEYRLEYHSDGWGNALNLGSSRMSRSRTENRSRLYFGNASYTYANRYTATFSARKDEANIFGVDINKRGRPFWSAGLRWQLHEEEFYKLDGLSKLVLRATYGYTGNVSNLSAYVTSKIADLPYNRTGRVYQTIVNPPNPKLGWEKVVMTNVAIEFSAFNDRFSGSVEHYRKEATDLLSREPINPSSGVTSLDGNWSSLKGWGWDLNLSTKNIKTRDLLWQSDLLLSYTNEKVTHYALTPSSDNMYLTSNLGAYPIVGKPLYGMYSFSWAGLDAAGQPQGYLDGVISKDYTNIYNNTRLGDYVYHGRATPPLFGSLRNSVRYKELELSFNISAQFGYYIRRAGLNYASLYSVQSYYSAPFQYDYVNRWQQSGDEARTHVPVAQYPVVGNRETFYGMSEVLVEKGDHIRLRDLRLAYSLKRNKAGMPTIQLYAYAQNIGVLWAANELGFDPDAVYGNGMSYPAPRSYALGVKADF